MRVWGRAARGQSPGAKMRLNGCLCCKKHTRGITRRAKAGPGALMGDERPGKDEAPGVRGQGPGARGQGRCPFGMILTLPNWPLTPDP